MNLSTQSILLIVGWFLTGGAVLGQNESKSDQPKQSTDRQSEMTRSKETRIYKNRENQDLSLQITKPQGWKPSDRRPAVVFFHGGAWVGGKPGQFNKHSEHLVKRGLVTIQAQYRLLKKTKQSTNPQIDKTPTPCIQDAKSAMRWVRSHAEQLGIDPERLASAGGSAGGHLAAFLGTTDGIDDPSDDLSVSARANAMLLFNPVYNNGPGGWGTARVGNRFPEFSPAHNISKDDAPCIVFLGTEDKLVPVETAKRFQKEMQELGIKSELRLYEGATHGFFNFNKENGKWYHLTMAEVDSFLDEIKWTTQGN